MTWSLLLAMKEHGGGMTATFNRRVLWHISPKLRFFRQPSASGIFVSHLSSCCPSPFPRNFWSASGLAYGRCLNWVSPSPAPPGADSGRAIARWPKSHQHLPSQWCRPRLKHLFAGERSMNNIHDINWYHVLWRQPSWAQTIRKKSIGSCTLPYSSLEVWKKPTIMCEQCRWPAWSEHMKRSNSMVRSSQCFENPGSWWLPALCLNLAVASRKEEAFRSTALPFRCIEAR